jgi:putative ABC transport system permease protein
MSWWNFLARDKRDEELAREMDAHLEHETELNVARGMSRENARDAAKRKLGNETRVREDVYEMNTLGWLDSMWQDLKYGARTLRKSPGFTLVAVLTLALGIGANTVIFSVINATMLRPLPFKDAQQLVLIFRSDQQNRLNDLGIDSKPDFEDYVGQADAFSSAALFDASRIGYNFAEGTRPERLQGVRITSDFFKTFGVQPMLGREFTKAEEPQGADHEVILSYRVWQRRYNSDPDILGKSVRIDGVGHTVVGVMPQDFIFQFWGNPGDVFIPVGYTQGDQMRGSHSFAVVARMKPGVTLAQADAEEDAIGRRLAAQYPDSNAGTTATALSLDRQGVDDVRSVLMVMFYVVGFVLLIACVNVANLSLARAATRRKEIAVRRALGAGRLRVVRQLLTESLLLAGLGCAAGLLLAYASLALIARALPDQLKDLPFRPIESIPMDGRVFAFALVLSCVTAVLFGIAPAFSAERTDASDALKSGGGRGATLMQGRLGRGLVAAEVALAFVVVVSAGLLVDSIVRVLRVDPGYTAKNVLTMNLSTPQTEIFYGPPVNERFCQQVSEALEAIPGVEHASAVSHLPLQGNAGRGLQLEGQSFDKPEDQPGAGYMIACPGSFAALGVKVIEGRDFTSGDTTTATPVTIVNETMAKKWWPKESAVGRRIRIGRAKLNEPWMTIVGVIGDVRQGGLSNPVHPVFYRPFPQAGWPQMSIVAKTAMRPAAVEDAAKRAMTQALPETPVSDVRSLDEVLRDSVSYRMVPTMVLSSFALLALLLAAVGIAGVVSYGVSQRTQEIGIRMTFGASARDVLAMIVSGSMRWVLVGVVVGVAGALAATRLLTDLLFGVKAWDPWVLVGVAALLAGVAFVASWWPARRATRVDPMVALRYE